MCIERQSIHGAVSQSVAWWPYVLAILRMDNANVADD
jgi:hypothetical protein